MVEGINAWDPAERRSPEPQRWDLVRDEHHWWGDLDAHGEDRLRRWLNGRL